MNYIEKMMNYAYKSYAPTAIYKDNIEIDDLSVRYFEFESDEKDIFWNNYYIPFRYIYINDICLMLFCLHKHKNLAFELIEKFQSNLFSQNCFDYIYNHISDDVRKMFNIFPVSEMRDYYDLHYTALEKSNLNLTAKQSTTIQFDENMKYDDICMKVDKKSLFYGTLIDNTIVSLASWGERPDNFVNIGVETHKNYRNKGYAVSNVVAMAEYILDSEKISMYSTDNKNIASQKTAIAAGLSEIGKVKLFVFAKR